MSDKQDRLIGTELGQYTIQEEIGRGGMATVYSATQRSMSRTVAIKVLPPHFLHDPGFLERFGREVEVISNLEHPHILPIYDYGEAEGVPYIAMRYLGGGSMAQLVRRGVPEIKELVKSFSQVCDALDYAHQQGIIHRDLKPGNIMLDEHGNAYLSDFGIARVMGSDLTGSAIIGTPAYMSPEQAHGSAIDARSDIYALGIVLFELITGREPYQAETPMSLLLKHINEPIPPLSQFREGVPESIQEVIEKATAKQPDDRYSSAGDMATAFADALASGATTKMAYDAEKTITDARPLPNKGGTLIGGTKPVVASGDLATESHHKQPVAQVPQESSSSRTLLYVAIVVIVLMIGAGVVMSGVLNPAATTPVVTVPTPFAGAAQINETNYSISIPNDLLPANAAIRYDDRSDTSRLLHVWDSGNGVYIALALVSADRTTALAYTRSYYDTAPSYFFIDADEAPDGTIRRSYRVEDDETLANGQLDVFFMEKGAFLAVIEMYTSDAIGNNDAQIAQLQQILDSVRITDTAN